MGWAASAFAMNADTPNARQQNVNAPTTLARTTPGNVDPGTGTPNASRPTMTMAATTPSATRIATEARPAISTHDGTGVARLRFSTPVSRCVTIETARLTNDEATIASVAMPGT